MIRYENATPAEIRNRVDAFDPKWIPAADARTKKIIDDGAFSEGAPSWSDIKPVFMRLQGNKCVFCEWPLGGEFAGKVTQDVEHYRPKNAVKTWPKAAKRGQPAKYAFPLGTAGGGYYWLAYDLGNYAAACKACNTARKSNYFPIAGNRIGAPQPVAALNVAEQPFLLFPLGTIDSDPEQHITFEGIVAKPVEAAGVPDRRGQVTIDFFALNEREELWEDRFRVIRNLFNAVEISQTSADPVRKAAAIRTIEDAISDFAPQASCARAFLKLLKSDPVLAWETYLAAEDAIASKK